MFVKFPTTALRWTWPYKFLDESVVILFTQSLWHSCPGVIFIQFQPGRKETSTVLLWKPTQLSREQLILELPEAEAVCSWSCPTRKCRAQSLSTHLLWAGLSFPSLLTWDWFFVWNTVILQIRTGENKSTAALTERLSWQTAHDSLWTQRNSQNSWDNPASHREPTNRLCNHKVLVNIWICFSGKKISAAILKCWHLTPI